MPTPLKPATSAASSAPAPPGVGAAAATADAPRKTAPILGTLRLPPNAATDPPNAQMYANVTSTEPPNSMVSFTGLLESFLRLVAEERTALTTGPSTLRRPHRVNSVTPNSA